MHVVLKRVVFHVTADGLPRGLVGQAPRTSTPRFRAMSKVIGPGLASPAGEMNPTVDVRLAGGRFGEQLEPADRGETIDLVPALGIGGRLDAGRRDQAVGDIGHAGDMHSGDRGAGVLVADGSDDGARQFDDMFEPGPVVNEHRTVVADDRVLDANGRHVAGEDIHLGRCDPRTGDRRGGHAVGGEAVDPEPAVGPGGGFEARGRGFFTTPRLSRKDGLLAPPEGAPSGGALNA